MTQLGAYFRAMPSLLRVGFAEMVAYRAEMVIWILTSMLPLVMLALWNAVAVGGPVGGFSQNDFARYFTVTLVVRQLTSAWVVWDLNYNVRTGGLSPLLLRPLNPLLWNLAETLAALPFRLAVLSPIVLALVWWRPEIAFWPGTLGAALGCVSVALAFALAWLVQSMFGMLAFWFEQSVGIYGLWFVGIALVGGYVIPLSLLPPTVEALARFLPFHSALGAPIEVWLGRAPDAAHAVLVQGVWVVVTAGAAAMMWGRGIRRYGAVGA